MSILNWAPSTGFVLESTTDLAAGNWQTASENPITNNGQLEVTAAIGPKQRYFRLYLDVDPFGIKKLYPTTEGGREWYLPDDTDLNHDSVFVPTTKDISIIQSGRPTVYHTQGNNGSEGEVRLNIHSPAGAAWWRNVEMTGYFRWTILTGGTTQWPHWELFARGERHSSSSVTKGSVNDGIAPPAGTVTWPWWGAFNISDTLNPAALGTAYHGNVYVNHGPDSAYGLFEKEISHIQGYADQRGRVSAAGLPPQQNAWLGIKFVVRNDLFASKVLLELWIDSEANGNWTKISSYTDQNGIGNDWAATAMNGTDQTPYDIAFNQLLTWAGPWVCFRSDEIGMVFKELSVREIDPTP